MVTFSTDFWLRFSKTTSCGHRAGLSGCIGIVKDGRALETVTGGKKACQPSVTLNTVLGEKLLAKKHIPTL
jgi:hypothetical protein